MSTAPDSVRGNPWAWFGTQVGCTAWMLTAILEFGLAPPAVPLTWLACFGLTNAIGWWLWRRQARGRLRFFRAAQGLILACTLLGLIAVAVTLGAVPSLRAREDWSGAFRLLIIVPALIGGFECLDRAERRRSIAARAR